MLFIVVHAQLKCICSTNNVRDCYASINCMNIIFHELLECHLHNERNKANLSSRISSNLQNKYITRGVIVSLPPHPNNISGVFVLRRCLIPC